MIRFDEKNPILGPALVPEESLAALEASMEANIGKWVMHELKREKTLKISMIHDEITIEELK